MPLHKVANTLLYIKRDIMIRLCNSETVTGFIWGRHLGIGEIRVSSNNYQKMLLIYGNKKNNTIAQKYPAINSIFSIPGRPYIIILKLETK